MRSASAGRRMSRTWSRPVRAKAAARAARSRSGFSTGEAYKEKGRRRAGLFCSREGGLRLHLRVAGIARLFLDRGTVHELDVRHRRVVALAEAHLEDAQVPAVARLVARAQLGEELHDHVAVAQAVEGEALVGERLGLAEGDDRLDDAAQLLGLRQRGLDRLVLEQRDGHVAQHREAMAAGAVELSKPVAVTHFGSSFFALLAYAALLLLWVGKSAPSGGGVLTW